MKSIIFDGILVFLSCNLKSRLRTSDWGVRDEFEEERETINRSLIDQYLDTVSVKYLIREEVVYR